MERRKAQRRSIQVDVEIGHPGFRRCSGYADSVSRNGLSVVLFEGDAPQQQRSVVLNFKIWTGERTLYRKMYARVARCDGPRIGFTFAEQDFVAQSVVQELLFYQKRERRRTPRALHPRSRPAADRSR